MRGRAIPMLSCAENTAASENKHYWGVQSENCYQIWGEPPEASVVVIG
jgi:hypothetical protein